MTQSPDPIASLAKRMRDNIQRVIIGKADVIDLALIALLCEGHVLIEDVPGIGKTTLAKAVARSLNCSFRRIQFTPDLLPSDVSGISFFNQKSQEFQVAFRFISSSGGTFGSASTSLGGGTSDDGSAKPGRRRQLTTLSKFISNGWRRQAVGFG